MPVLFNSKTADSSRIGFTGDANTIVISTPNNSSTTGTGSLIVYGGISVEKNVAINYNITGSFLGTVASLGGITANGDTIYHNGTTYTRLGSGIDGTKLMVVSGIPAYNTTATITETSGFEIIVATSASIGGTSGSTPMNSTTQTTVISSTYAGGTRFVSLPNGDIENGQKVIIFNNSIDTITPPTIVVPIGNNVRSYAGVAVREIIPLDDGNMISLRWLTDHWFIESMTTNMTFTTA